MYLSVGEYAHLSAEPLKAKRGIRSLGAKVVFPYKLPDMGAGIWTRVFYKNSIALLPIPAPTKRQSDSSRLSMVVHGFNLRRQRQVYLCEFEAI